MIYTVSDSKKCHPPLAEGEQMAECESVGWGTQKGGGQRHYS